MKYIIFLSLLLSSLVADKLTIGAGPYIQTQPYKNTKSITVPSPVLFYDNGIAYIRWTRIGLYFLGESKDEYSWGFSLTALPRPYGYLASDSVALHGMDERKTSWEGGLAFGAKVDKAYIEILAVSDLLNANDAWVIKTEIGYEFKVNNFSFYPSVIAVYQSSNFVNYYYGVKQEEVTTSRSFYHPNADMQYGLQTYIQHPITDGFSFFANFKADLLSSEVTSSPIVDDNFIYSGILSLIYTFEQ